MSIKKRFKLWKYRHTTLVSCSGVLCFFLMLMIPVLLLAVDAHLKLSSIQPIFTQ